MDTNNNIKYKLSDFYVKSLGERKVDSPIIQLTEHMSGGGTFIEPDERILYDPNIKSLNTTEELISFEKVGAHEKIFFDPSKTKVGIVTCGGLCPGLNNVIRGLVMELYYRYDEIGRAHV